MAGCDADRLSDLADEYLRIKSLAWPLTTLTTKTLLGQPLVNPFLKAEEVEAMSEIGFATAFEENILPGFIEELPEKFAAPLRSCVAVRAGRIKSPHATTLDWRPAGVMVLYNGGLPGLLGAILGHALARVEIINEEQVARVRLHRPDDEQIVALAGALYGWLHPNRTDHLHSLPDIGLFTGGAGRMFFNLLWAAERFVLGHELTHALTLLGAIPGEGAAVRELVEREDLPEDIAANWIRELSADVTGFYLSQLAAGDDTNRQHNAVVGALTTVVVLDVLDWVVSYPSVLPFPPDLDDPPQLSIFVSHPPGELRTFVLKEEASAVHPTAIQEFNDVQLSPAVYQLLFRLQELSDGGCIAPDANYEPQALCRQPRAEIGWYCQQHRWQ